MTEEPAKSSRKSSDSEKISLENKKNVSLVLLVAAWFIPFLWPFAIAGTIGMFPKTSKKIGIGAFVLTGVAIAASRGVV
jgi:hypothetical protein